MLARVEKTVGFGLATIVALGAAVPAHAHGTTERVSVGSGGVEADDASVGPAISGDGRFVAFISCAANLVPGDTSPGCDVFVRDRRVGTTERASLGPGGIQANGSCYSASISADGRFVGFTSDATNLVEGDTNGAYDAFVRDLQTDTTERISVGPRGIQANSYSYSPEFSSHGRFVAFESVATNLVPGDSNRSSDVFVRDRTTGLTARVNVSTTGTQGNGYSARAAISADGRFVAFESVASNLVPGDSGVEDVFVRDRKANRTKRIGAGDQTSEGPAISADGRFVAFTSYADNLVPGDTNETTDVFVENLQTRTIQRVSVGAGGLQADGSSFAPAISADGRFVAFSSVAGNLVSDDNNGKYDIFVFDRNLGKPRRASVGPRNVEADGDSFVPSIAADGHHVAFQSDATNLVLGDTNGVTDVFIRALVP
jgi:Tol biopolymer transport system component